MARPVRSRRSGGDTPDADDYAPSRSRSGDDEERTERRPSRGRSRGELPGRGKKEEPPVDLPKRKGGVETLEDEDFDALAEYFGLTDPTEDELWDAIEASREEPKDDEPRSSRRRGRDDEEDEKPSRSRRSRSDEDDEDKPRRGRRSSSDEDEDKPRGRGRSRDEDDQDDRPKRKRRAGFEGYKKTRQETFTDEFKVTEEELLVKFLEDEPFDTWAEHHLFQELNEGQRIWICVGEDCPICATGHKPKAFGAYNIVVLPEEGDPHVEVLKAGPGLSAELEKKASLKTGPLSKEYYALYMVKPEKGKKGFTTYEADVVRERDVVDEWKVDPFTDKELDEFREDVVDPDTYIQFPPMSALRGVAKALRDAD